MFVLTGFGELCPEDSWEACFTVSVCDPGSSSADFDKNPKDFHEDFILHTWIGVMVATQPTSC